MNLISRKLESHAAAVITGEKTLGPNLQRQNHKSLIS